MAMSRAERVQRLAQLRDQLASVTEEIQRLEREDETFVAYAGRAQAARQSVLPYADFARYATAHEQLEAAWAQAGRPVNWAQRPLLIRLREVLIVPAATGAPVAAPAGAGPPARPVAPPQPATPAAPPVARPGTSPNGAAAPGAAGPTNPTASPPLPGAPTRSTPAPHQTPAPAAPAARGRAATHESMAEQHSPILNEVVELSKRAEEEFRLAQVPAGLGSCDRAIYLLERVYLAPPALVNRLIKLLDDAVRGSTLPDSDRQRWEQIKTRAEVLLGEEAP